MEEITIICFGLILGSFLNVVIYRLPLEKSIVRPGSHCPACDRPVKFYDNIPVLSFLFLGGKCRFCKTEISLRYPLVEMFTGFTLWICYYYFGNFPVHAGFTALFLLILIALAFIDYDHQILPDELTLGGAAVFLVYAFFNPMISTVNAIVTSIGSALAFTALYFFYIKIRKIEGLGQGDIKMMLLLGAFLGVNKLVTAVLIASFAGMLVGLFFILFKGRDMKLKLPFGTFLSLGSYIAVFWGVAILKTIKSFYNLN